MCVKSPQIVQSSEMNWKKIDGMDYCYEREGEGGGGGGEREERRERERVKGEILVSG